MTDTPDIAQAEFQKGWLREELRAATIHHRCTEKAAEMYRLLKAVSEGDMLPGRLDIWANRIVEEIER